MRTSLPMRVEALEHRFLLSAGEPDPGFGTGGLVRTHFDLGPALVASVLVQPDAKIVVAGTLSTSAGPGSFALVRYNPDGSLDSGFGTGGQVLTAGLGTAAAAALQADGKILVVGGSFVLARYSAVDGSLDATFGTGGVVRTQFMGVSNIQATGIAIQSDGKIVVSGVSTATPPSPTLRGGVVARYDAAGNLDPAFGMGGEITTGVGDRLLLQPDGKIVLGGQSEVWTMTFGISFATYVERVNADGGLDLGFGSSGRAAFDFGGGMGTLNITSLALERDGTIVAAGPTERGAGLLRLNPDGSTDASFGLGGKVVNVASVQALGIQTDGKILLAGVPSGGNFAVTRLDTDGSRDTRFGVAGTAMISPSAAPGTARAVALQPDGQIVVAGILNGDVAVVRYIGGPSAPLAGTPNQQFITQLYLDLLARGVDPDGLAFWSGQLDQAATTRVNVVLAIENSPEYRARVIEDLYSRLFGRAADTSGLNTWSDLLARGGTAKQLEALLLGSTEYSVLSGSSDNGFLNALYHDTLYRSPDNGGAQSWSQILSAGVPRSAVAAALLASTEFDTNQVQSLYHRFLHRPADSSGFATFFSAVQRGISHKQLIALVAGSEEYFSTL